MILNYNNPSTNLLINNTVIIPQNRVIDIQTKEKENYFSQNLNPRNLNSSFNIGGTHSKGPIKVFRPVDSSNYYKTLPITTKAGN